MKLKKSWNNSTSLKGYLLLLAIALLASTSCICQSAATDILTLDNFILRVKKYHPVARQGDLQVDKARAELLTARGSFDPYFQLNASNKTFDDKNYYYYYNPEINIPLPVGNLKTGVENNGGNFLSSEITPGKTSYLGVELPLAKGLLMDKRRAVLQQAKIFTQQSIQERLLILNNLLFESYVAYWQWAGAYQQYAAYTRFVDVANKRLQLIRNAFVNGDRALMDTTEAYTQVQNYQLMQMEAFVNWKNAGLELSNYLWKENDSIYLLKDRQLPENIQPAYDAVEEDTDGLILQSFLQNPSLKIYDYKLISLEVERKLKLQNILPYFSVKANLLNKDFNVLKNVNPAFIENNYKWGIEFKLPLFLREARGEYKRTQLKIKETNLDLSYKKLQIENKIRTYTNEFSAIKKQLQQLQSIYLNYQNLLRNEELKFAQGESSLFLVNSREIKLIEIIQKQIELSVKYYKAKYAIGWATGSLK
ncbi:TolC family protein [soil metagenome]